MYIQLKTKSQFSSSPVQQDKMLLFVQSDSSQCNIMGKKSDGTFVQLTKNGLTQKQVQNIAIVNALVFG